MFKEFFALPRLWAGAIVAAVLVAAVLGYGEWRASSARGAERAKWEQATAKLQATAATTLAAETAKVLATERALAAKTVQLEELADAGKKTAADYERRLADRVVAGAGRLRDPNGTCGRGGDSAVAAPAAAAPGRDADGGPSGWLLSADLTQLLLGVTRDADALNVAYAACRSYALQLQGIVDRGEQGKLSPP